MKTCIKCEIPKERDGFYYTSSKKCKECVKDEVHQNRLSKVDYYQEYDRKRANLPHRIALRKQVTETWARDGRHAASQERYKEKYPEKYKAHNIFHAAVRDGKIIKPESCSTCGIKSKNLEGHHTDYSKPLDVQWLCVTCHSNTRRTYPKQTENLPYQQSETLL